MKAFWQNHHDVFPVPPVKILPQEREHSMEIQSQGYHHLYLWSPKHKPKAEADLAFQLLQNSKTLPGCLSMSHKILLSTCFQSPYKHSQWKFINFKRKASQKVQQGKGQATLSCQVLKKDTFFFHQQNFKHSLSQCIPKYSLSSSLSTLIYLTLWNQIQGISLRSCILSNLKNFRFLF